MDTGVCRGRSLLFSMYNLQRGNGDTRNSFYSLDAQLFQKVHLQKDNQLEPSTKKTSPESFGCAAQISLGILIQAMDPTNCAGLPFQRNGLVRRKKNQPRAVPLGLR